MSGRAKVTVFAEKWSPCAAKSTAENAPEKCRFRMVLFQPRFSQPRTKKEKKYGYTILHMAY